MERGSGERSGWEGLLRGLVWRRGRARAMGSRMWRRGREQISSGGEVVGSGGSREVAEGGVARVGVKGDAGGGRALAVSTRMER